MKSNKLKNILATLLLLCSINVTYLYSAFWELKPGAKSGGMGFAYSAIVKNAESVFYNPANLVYTVKPNIFIEYSKLYYGLDFDSLGYKSIFYSIPETEIGSFGAGFSAFDGNFYSESTYFLSYSKSFLSGGSKYSAGVTFKYLKKNIDKNYSNDISNDPFFDEFGTALSNFTFDLGLTYRSNSGFINSFVAKNITHPNMAYQSGINESLPMILTYGVAKKYNILFPTFFSVELEMMDTSIGKDLNQIWYAFGMENDLYQNNLFTRFGFNKNELSAGLSYSNLTYSKFNLSFDYSISIPFSFTDESLPASLSTHRFGFNVFYGTILKKPELNDRRWSKKIPNSFALNDNSLITDERSDVNKKEVVLWVKDRAGNISNSISSITIDTKLPTLTDETDIKIIEDDKISLYLLIFTENADYFRYKNNSDWSDWIAIADEENNYENLVNDYDASKLNYITYQLKDRAGNIFEDKIIIQDNKKRTDLDIYPVLDDIIMKNKNSSLENDTFQSKKIILEVITQNNSFDDILFKADKDIDKPISIYNKEEKSSKSFTLDISKLDNEGIYKLYFNLVKGDLLSNTIEKTIYIDNTIPKSYYKIHSKKTSTGYHGSTLKPSLTIYQSFDTREWNLTSDTTSIDIDKNWVNLKPHFYDFTNSIQMKSKNNSIKKDKTNNHIKKYQLFLKVKDEAGNESKWYKNYFYYDDRAPQIEKFSLESKFVNKRYILSSNKIEPNIKLKSTDYVEFIFDDNSTKRYEVDNDTIIYNSSLTIPIELNAGKVIIRSYNNENVYDEKSFQYLVNIDKPIVSEFKVFDKVTGSTSVTSNQKVGLYIHGVNIDRIQISDNINFENSTYYSYNSPLIDYNLLDKEGLQYIFVRVKNNEQVSSNTYSAVIKLDRVKPHLDYSITTLDNNIVNLTTVEILYNNETISNDITGYYFTEQIEDIPKFNSNKWSLEKINFYTFKSSEDGVKELFLYLKDDARNISEPIRKVVILEKFKQVDLADTENPEKDKNSIEDIFFLSDFETGSTEVTDIDLVKVNIPEYDNKYTAWLLSEVDLSAELNSSSDKWLTKKPYKYAFNKNSEENSVKEKTVYLFLRDRDGVINRTEIKNSITVDKFKTLPGQVIPKPDNEISINNSTIDILFNKELHKKLGVEEITVYCSGNKSGYHNSKLNVNNKIISIELMGQFSENETIYVWIFGNYYDLNMKKGFISKKLRYSIEGVKSESKLVVSGAINKLSGFINEYMVEGTIENLPIDFTSDIDNLDKKYTSYIFAPVQNFGKTERKRFNSSSLSKSDYTMSYEFSELVEGEEIIFRAQYFTNTGEKSELFETTILTDVNEPESRLYLFSEKGSNVGYSNNLNLKVEVKADYDSKEFNFKFFNLVIPTKVRI